MTDEILTKMKERKAEKRGSKPYNEMDKEMRKMYDSAKEQWYNENCKETERLEKEHRSRELHNKVKELTNRGKRGTRNACITNKNGEMLFEEEAIQERWCEYVRELFDDQRGNIQKFNQLEGPEILIKEVENAIKSMKNGKAPGDDGVTSEMLQALDQLGVTRVAELCNKIYDTGHIPEDLKKSTFYPFQRRQKQLAAQITEQLV